MPSHTRSKTRELADPLAGIQSLMGKMSMTGKTPKAKTPRTKKTVSSDDMLANMLSGLTLGKSTKSRRRKRTGFSKRKTHKSKTHKMITTGGRRRRRRGRRSTRHH